MSNSFPPASQKQRIIITGGAGFIGSHLADYLLSHAYEVVAIDNLSTGQLSNLQAARKSPYFTFHTSDVCAFDWKKHLRPTDTIVHLASTVGVMKVCESALATSENNHQMSSCILKAALPYRNRVLYASTSEVYGETKSTLGSRETDPLEAHVLFGGRSAYTLSKAYGEMQTLAYQEQYGLPVAIMRFFNTTGPRQSAAYGMVAPRFIQQAMQGKPITIYGSGEQVRSFCSVFDTIRAIEMLIAKPQLTGIFNIGNSEAITIKQLAEYVLEITHSRSKMLFQPLPPERAGMSDIRFRKPNLSHTKAVLGWSPQYNWQQAIAALIPHLQNSTT
jgi:UDP-glucose 4-epimerase